MKMNKTRIATIVLLPILCLTGCSSATNFNKVSYNDQNFTEMTQDIQNVICDVKGKQIMEKQDVDNFRALTDRLETYHGAKKTQVDEVIVKLDDIAANWSASLGIDLGESNGAMLTDLCTKMENS